MNISLDQSNRLEAQIEYHPIIAKDKARLHQIGKTILRHLCGICATCGRKLEERDILVPDTEE